MDLVNLPPSPPIASRPEAADRASNLLSTGHAFARLLDGMSFETELEEVIESAAPEASPRGPLEGEIVPQQLLVPSAQREEHPLLRGLFFEVSLPVPTGEGSRAASEVVEGVDPAENAVREEKFEPSVPVPRDLPAVAPSVIGQALETALESRGEVSVGEVPKPSADWKAPLSPYVDGNIKVLIAAPGVESPSSDGGFAILDGRRVLSGAMALKPPESDLNCGTSIGETRGSGPALSGVGKDGRGDFREISPRPHEMAQPSLPGGTLNRWGTGSGAMQIASADMISAPSLYFRTSEVPAALDEKGAMVTHSGAGDRWPFFDLAISDPVILSGKSEGELARSSDPSPLPAAPQRPVGEEREPFFMTKAADSVARPMGKADGVESELQGDVGFISQLESRTGGRTSVAEVTQHDRRPAEASYTNPPAGPKLDLAPPLAAEATVFPIFSRTASPKSNARGEGSGQNIRAVVDGLSEDPAVLVHRGDSVVTVEDAQYRHPDWRDVAQSVALSPTEIRAAEAPNDPLASQIAAVDELFVSGESSKISIGHREVETEGSLGSVLPKRLPGIVAVYGAVADGLPSAVLAKTPETLTDLELVQPRSLPDEEEDAKELPLPTSAMKSRNAADLALPVQSVQSASGAVTAQVGRSEEGPSGAVSAATEENLAYQSQPLHSVQASEQVLRAPPPQVRDHALSSPVQQVAMVIREGELGGLELRLQPEELGAVRISLLQDGDVLRVMVQAERGETLDLLRRGSVELQQALQQAGYFSTSFSFQRSDAQAHGAHSWMIARGDPEPEPPAYVPRQVAPGRLDLRL